MVAAKDRRAFGFRPTAFPCKAGTRVRCIFGGAALIVEVLPGQLLYAPEGFVGVVRVAEDGTEDQPPI